MNNIAVLMGRLGLALIFILWGLAKIGGYKGTQQRYRLRLRTTVSETV